MAYTSKYTGPEIDRRLEQGTYDDAVAAGFTGSKEEFYKQLAAYNPQEQEKLNNKQDKEDSTLETENKSIVGAINEINSIKQDKVDERLTTDSKIIVEAINEVKYNTIVLEQNKQPREDLGFSTKQKTVVGAVNELNLKIGELDESKQNAEDDRLDTNDTTVIGAINEINDNLKAEIERSKTIDEILETLNIKQVTPDSENYASAYELQDSTGKVYGSRINITKDQFLKNVSYENNILTLTFILADGTESTQQVDLTGLVDEYIAGAGISVTTTDDGKKVINIADDALQKIQYADSEVRRLEQDKIPYAYDEKTQSNINVILPEGGSYLGNYGDENATVAKAAVYDGVKQLEIGSSKVHTNINTDSDVTIETSTGKKTIATTDELVNEVNIPIRSLQDKVYTQEEIFDWFGVTSVPELKQKISRGSQMYLRYGILLSGNPMYYKMPIEYTAFESANQIKLVFVGLNTRDDVTSKYEIIMNLDGTIIEGNSNVKVTITSVESGDIDLSKYQTIDDDSLTTSAKTIPAAINEIKESVDSISDPYEINLTNLLSAEDSESISTAIGGIDNLNATVQDNRIIVGTISNGSVSVSIRILGNVTTLYYLLDSVVGLTLNEIAITNTSGTLSKTVNTHSVLTENMVINSLTSDETTLPLSAAQGKALNEKILNNGGAYIIDIWSLIDSPTSEQISEAIGGWDNLVQAIADNMLILALFPGGYYTGMMAASENKNKLHLVFYGEVQLVIVNTDGTLTVWINRYTPLYREDEYSELSTGDKTIVGAINENYESIEQIKGTQSQSNVFEVNLDSLNRYSNTTEILEAIGGSFENLVQAILDGKVFVEKGTGTNDVDFVRPYWHVGYNVFNEIRSTISFVWYDDTRSSNTTPIRYDLVNSNGVLSFTEVPGDALVSEQGLRMVNMSYLKTNNKTVLGAINEINTLANSKADSQDITNAINALDKAEVSAGTGEVISSVSQENGVVSVSKRSLTSNDIPTLPQSKITDLETTLAGKQDAGDYATNSALIDGLAAKQDTLTSGTGIEITPENQINVTLDTTVFKVVSVLPDSPAQGDENKIHLVPAESTGANNAYTEYVWVNSAWEILGEYTSEVDLTPYLKTVDAESTYLKITDAESEYATKTDLAAKQNATDDTLGTTDKTIVGAINEILSKQVIWVGKPSSGIGGEIFNNYADNQASGNYAHAEGSDTKASGDYSHAEGYQTTASGDYSHAEGKYNYDDSSAIHMVGIGTSSIDRKNAHVIDFGGDHYVYGVGGFDGTNSESAKSLQEVINNDKAENFTVGTGLEMTPERVLNITTDLTSYLKSTDAANTYLSKTDAASTYATAANLTAHTGNTENPHNVTASQVGLGNVDNTSDEDKPVSTAQQTALDLKQNITDNTLQTTAKTIVGAINEVNGKVKDDTIILYSNTYSLTSWTTAYNNANSALALALTNAFNNYNHIILRDGNKTDTTFYEYHVTQIAADNGEGSTKYFKYCAGLDTTTWWLITLTDFTVVIQNIQ